VNHKEKLKQFNEILKVFDVLNVKMEYIDHFNSKKLFDIFHLGYVEDRMHYFICKQGCHSYEERNNRIFLDDILDSDFTLELMESDNLGTEELESLIPVFYWDRWMLQTILEYGVLEPLIIKIWPEQDDKFFKKGNYKDISDVPWGALERGKMKIGNDVFYVDMKRGGSRIHALRFLGLETCPMLVFSNRKNDISFGGIDVKNYYDINNKKNKHLSKLKSFYSDSTTISPQDPIDLNFGNVESLPEWFTGISIDLSVGIDGKENKNKISKLKKISPIIEERLAPTGESANSQIVYNKKLSKVLKQLQFLYFDSVKDYSELAKNSFPLNIYIGNVQSDKESIKCIEKIKLSTDVYKEEVESIRPRFPFPNYIQCNFKKIDYNDLYNIPKLNNYTGMSVYINSNLNWKRHYFIFELFYFGHSKKALCKHQTKDNIILFNCEHPFWKSGKKIEEMKPEEIGLLPKHYNE
tara:strand:- start:122 stop:1519 length:1398 start_codon:yes stop_codon:yes gene_type:complete